MQDAREKLNARHMTNHHLAHSSLGHLTPGEFIKRGQINNWQVAQLAVQK
jgi:hypothetical protein